MKFYLLTILLLISCFGFCQSLEDTIDWIGMNSKGREFVRVSNDKSTINIISVRKIPNVLTDISGKEFNPKNVRHVSIVYRKDDWNSILIAFKDDTTRVTHYDLKTETNERYNIDNRNMKGIEIYLNADKQLIDKYKKAFLHLFKLLGADVKDGNFF